MKRYETLKAIVILQAVSMIALAAFVIWQFWPKSDGKSVSPTHDQSKANAEDEVVAVIADQKITKQQLVDELLVMHGDQTLQNMLEHYAIKFASEENNIKVTEQEIQDELGYRSEHYDSVDEYVKVMTEQVGILPNKLYQDIEDELLLIKLAIKDVHISEADINNYIESRPDRYANNYLYGLSWIVVDNEELASEIMQKLEQGYSFEVLAGQYSTDEYTASDGGKLGLIDADDTLYPAVLRNTALSLEVGSLTGPLKLDEQFAIVKLNERKVVKHITDQQRRQLVKQELALEQVDSLELVLERIINEYGSLIKKQKL